MGVDSSATWEEITQSYRRKVQAAHPDRARGNPRIEKIAQAKFDEIQSAFDELKRYRRIFGELPSDILENPARPKRPRFEAPDADPEPTQTATPEPPEPPEPIEPVLPDSGPSRIPRRWLAAAALVAAAVIWLTPGPQKPAFKAPTVSATDESNQPPAHVLVGLTKTEVLERLGPPDSSADERWTYGPAELNLIDNRVATVDDPGELLTLIDRSAPAKPQSLALQITKIDVLDLLGPPVTATEQVWTYGESQVWFADGNLVSGWESSPGTPLPARKPAAGQRPARQQVKKP